MSPKEELRKEFLDLVDEDEVIEFAKRLLRIPSYSGEETEAAKFLASFMEENGLEVELQEVERGRLQAIGRLRGTGEGRSLAFNGHIDIDPVCLGYTIEPFRPVVKDGRLYGHGVFNMKAGVVANVMAAIAVKRSGIQLKGNLLVECVVGELQGGVGTAYTIEHGIVPDMAIVAEPTNLCIRTKHVSVVQLLISTRGTAKWIGWKILDKKSVNAIEKMCKVIHALKNIHFTCYPDPEMPELPSMLIGGIMGGMGRTYSLKRPSIVPDICTISVDIRYSVKNGMTTQSIKKDVERVLEKLKRKDPDLTTEIKMPPAAYKKPWEAMKLVMPPLDLSKDEYIVQVVKQNHKYVTGEEIKQVGIHLPGSYAGTDAGHLWKAGTKAIVYGPSWGSPGHGSPPDAYVEINNLITCTRVLALTAIDVCGIKDQ